MVDYYEGYNINRVVYDLIKYDYNFRTIWDNLRTNNGINNELVDRVTAINILNGILPLINSEPARAAVTEYINVISRDTVQIDPILPILVARVHYYKLILSRSYPNIWQYYYPDTEEQMNRFKLPYDNFPVFATEESRKYVDMITEDQSQYICRLEEYANRVQKSYTVDELIEVCTNVNGVAQQININGLSTVHNNNVHKLMTGIHIIARNSTESPYTVITNSTILSQSTYESNVYLTTIDTVDRPLSMITKVNKSGELYGPFFEYVLGTFLNNYIPQVPGFMYSYGYYDGLPPSPIGSIAPVIGYKNNINALVNKKYYEGFFQYLSSSITLDNMIVNPTYEAMLNGVLLSHADTVLLVYLILLNNIAYMNYLSGFVHGDLHAANVLVTVLPVQYNVTIRLYNGNTIDSNGNTVPLFEELSVVTNLYVYVIDYGYGSIRTSSDEYIYSRQMPIPIPNYASDATQDIHSALMVLTVRMRAGMKNNAFDIQYLRFIYNIYSMLFTGRYTDTRYNLAHYDTAIRILNRGQKYSMPQDTVYTMRTLQTFNNRVADLLQLSTTSIEVITLFDTTTELSTDVVTDLPTVYLTNACRSVLTSYYTSIERTVAVNNILNNRINRLNITNNFWSDLVQYLRNIYGSLVTQSRDDFKSNNMALIPILGNETANSLFDNMYSYAYNLRIRTVLLAMSRYYNVNPDLISDITNRMVDRDTVVRQIINYIVSDYNRLDRLLNTVSYSNLLQYSYGTYNGYLLNNLDIVED